MPPITKVALAGASGSIGKPVLEHLISCNFTVTVLTREDSTSTFPTGVKVLKVDYASEESLTAALQGQDALISTLANKVISSQDILIKAAIAAFVYRIIPSEFGLPDWNVAMAGTLIIMAPPLIVVIVMQRWFVRGLISTEK